MTHKESRLLRSGDRIAIRQRLGTVEAIHYEAFSVLWDDDRDVELIYCSEAQDVERI